MTEREAKFTNTGKQKDSSVLTTMMKSPKLWFSFYY